MILVQQVNIPNTLLGLDTRCDTLTVRAKILDEVKSPLGRRDFLRVKIRKNNAGELEAEPITLGRSGLLRNVVKANGIVQIPEQVEIIQNGEYIDVELFEKI